MKALSKESRLLIDAARDGDDPDATDRKRIRSALTKKLALGAAAGAVAATATHAASGGVTAGAGIGAGAAGGAGAAVSSLAAGAVTASFGAKVLVSVALLGAMGAGTVGYVLHEQGKRATRDEVRVASVDPATARLAAKGSPPAPRPPAPVPPPPARTNAVAPSPAVPTLAAPAKLGSAAAPAMASSAPAPSDLDVELALLQEVHAALQIKDGPRALRLLDEHTRRFPSGALGEESEAARVFALCQVGRPDEARDVAGRFLREHARSPLAPRVAHACDADAAKDGNTTY